MRDLCRVIVLLLVAANSFGQLTEDQKISDFQNVVGVYNKNYGPYEWKRDAMGFDLLNTDPWLAKIRATKNDLDFYEVMVSYVASLNDAHDFYGVPSNFSARLNFGVDIRDRGESAQHPAARGSAADYAVTVANATCHRCTGCFNGRVPPPRRRRRGILDPLDKIGVTARQHRQVHHAVTGAAS